MLFRLLIVTAIIGSAVAQRPANVSICDFYTTALLHSNTAANQKILLTMVVNTAVVGNYTQPNVGIQVAGILAPGEFNGTAVNLLPYFNGGFESTNIGGQKGVSRNFLDGGGAAPLIMNMPANGTSNQYVLLTHLYEFFGVLLGCSLQGGSEYPSYAGEASMYEVHKFMNLSYAEVGYFITQVAEAAASFGVAVDDLHTVVAALGSNFGYRCLPPTTIVQAQGPQLQSICTSTMCPLAANASCTLYTKNLTEPAVANVTLPGNSPSGNSSSGNSSSGTGVSSATGSTTARPPPLQSSGAGIAGLSVAILSPLLAFLV